MIMKKTIKSLMTPWVCSIAIHEVVRTRSDVQNGSSTRIINRFEYLSGSVDNR